MRWIKTSERYPKDGRYFTILENQSRSINDFSIKMGWRSITPLQSEVSEWLDEDYYEDIEALKDTIEMLLDNIAKHEPDLYKIISQWDAFTNVKNNLT